MADNVSIRGLEFKIVENSNQAISSLEKLRSTLERLKVATKGGVSGVGSSARQIERLNKALNSIPSSVGKLNALADGMKSFSSASNLKVSSSFAKQITLISEAVRHIEWTDGDKIEALANGLRPLTTLGKANLGSLINQLKKLPEVVAGLETVDLGKFAKQMRDVAAAVKPLADEMNKVAAGFASFPSKIQTLVSSSERYNQSMNKMGNTTHRFSGILKGIKWSIGYIGITRLAHAIGYAITKSNAFQENMNLFTVSMGEYAGEALKFGKQVEEIMGIDLSDWIRNQGLFNTLLIGFGNTAERAAIMSKNLTQLGYDLASLRNIPVEVTMQKLQSAIAGELEPIRSAGYDITQARLELTALNLGIEKQVSDMTQAEKAELRYYAIMTQLPEAQGDMARSLESPANQLRVLTSQFSMAAREIGNIFIPALNAILPYAIAVVKVIREIAAAIASLFGFKMTEVNYSGLKNMSAGAGALADNMESAAGSAKKLKDYTLGLDELNVFNPNKGGGGSAGGGVGGGEGFDFELPEYDFIGDAVNERVNKILDNLKSKVEDLKEAFSGFKKISFKPLINNLDNLFKPLNRLSTGLWDGILWGVENVLTPLSEIVIEEALPAVIDDLGASLDFLDSVLELGEPAFESFLGDFLLPLTKIYTIHVSELLHYLADQVRNLASSIRESNLGGTLKDLTDIFTLLINPTNAVLDVLTGYEKLKIATVIEEIKSKFKLLADEIGILRDLLKFDFTGVWEHLENMFANSKIAIFIGLIKELIDYISKLISKIHSFKDIFKIFTKDFWRVPDPEEPTRPVRRPGKNDSFGTRIPVKGDGGFVGSGQLFIAREAGAEMVGSIGRKTAVANNDQIVESVTSGVAVANDGVIAAIYNLINAVERKEMSVSIGDDEIGASYDRYSLNRGVGVNEGAFANAY